jgi:hypothetical protein
MVLTARAVAQLTSATHSIAGESVHTPKCCRSAVSSCALSTFDVFDCPMAGSREDLRRPGALITTPRLLNERSRGNLAPVVVVIVASPATTGTNKANAPAHHATENQHCNG